MDHKYLTHTIAPRELITGRTLEQFTYPIIKMTVVFLMRWIDWMINIKWELDLGRWGECMMVISEQYSIRWRRGTQETFKCNLFIFLIVYRNFLTRLPRRRRSDVGLWRRVQCVWRHERHLRRGRHVVLDAPEMQENLLWNPHSAWLCQRQGRRLPIWSQRHVFL